MITLLLDEMTEEQINLYVEVTASRQNLCKAPFFPLLNALGTDQIPKTLLYSSRSFIRQLS